jgi:hypothetical protein
VTGTTPDGEATGNATLEGLTITRSGREIISSMEGTLSGDVSASGDATFHRFLIYEQEAGLPVRWNALEPGFHGVLAGPVQLGCGAGDSGVA